MALERISAGGLLEWLRPPGGGKYDPRLDAGGRRMDVFDLSTLPEELHPQLGSLNALNGDVPQDIRFIRRLRRLKYPASDYYAVYAVEDGQILSRVDTIDLEFTSSHGRETVVGVSDVFTLPSAVRRGFAETLLEEVHRRAERDGRAWAFLWTHRSWGAHRLYENLGYRDVFSPPNALRRVAASHPARLPKGYSWRKAGRSDTQLLERLLLEGTRGRLGFVPRFRGSFRVRFELGWRTPENHGLLLRGRTPVGYAHTSPGAWCLTANEVVTRSAEDQEAILEALEATARGKWLSFVTTTFVTDNQAQLLDRGYLVYPSSHQVLMSKNLGRGLGPAGDLAEASASREFSSHRGDIF